jgi:putative oxidoreductase
MKIAIVIVRVLLGLLFLFASVTYFMHATPPPELQGNAKLFTDGLTASEYMMPLVKSIELLCAIAFLTGRMVTLANIVILPVTVNILMINIFLLPEGLPIALAVFLANLFLIYAYRDNYRTVFRLKRNENTTLT